MGKTLALIAGVGAAAAAGVGVLLLAHHEEDQKKKDCSGPVHHRKAIEEDILDRVMHTDETGRPVRRGAYRELWLSLTDHVDFPLLAGSDRYYELCALGAPQDADLCAVIERDLPRTFPKSDLFQVSYVHAIMRVIGVETVTLCSNRVLLVVAHPVWAHRSTYEVFNDVFRCIHTHFASSSA